MQEIWKKRFIRKYVDFIYRYGAYKRETTSYPPPLFLPLQPPYFTVPARPARFAYIGNIYFYYGHLSRSWVNRFLVTAPVEIDSDAFAAPMLPEINKWKI